VSPLGGRRKLVSRWVVEDAARNSGPRAVAARCAGNNLSRARDHLTQASSYALLVDHEDEPVMTALRREVSLTRARLDVLAGMLGGEAA
jgi:hypothetical protein